MPQVKRTSLMQVEQPRELMDRVKRTSLMQVEQRRDPNQLTMAQQENQVSDGDLDSESTKVVGIIK